MRLFGKKRNRRRNSATATGDIQLRTYDALDRLVQIDDPATGITQITYDANGNVASSTNGLNNTTTFEYDAANQRTKAIDPLLGERLFAYGLRGEVETITDERGQITDFFYDLLTRLNGIERLVGGNFLFTQFLHDKRNRITRVTDPNGQIIINTYDDLSRLTRIATPDNVIDFTYDAVGNMLTATDNDSSVARTYDGLNRVVTQQTLVGGIQPVVTLTNAFDAVGNRVSLTDTEGGVTQMAYDAVGRLVQLITPGAGTIDLSLDATGRRSQIAFPNGVATDFQYDLNGHLSDVTHSIGVTELVGFGYTYSAVGNILAIAEQTGTRDFTYDALQRLTAGGFAALPESYTYDAVGNRTTSHLSATHVTDSANRLTEDDAFTYTYDDNGNLTAKTDKVTTDMTGYVYDAQNQLIRITFPDLSTANYRYDGLNRRIEKDVSGAITRYVYDGEDIVLEYDGTNTLLARYSHGPGRDQPLAMERGGQGFFYQADHQGSIRLVTDAAGFVVNTYEYDSYGNFEAVAEGVPNPYTYTGREQDPESGLYYYRARYYDPTTGRFINEDPISYAGLDVNLYRYVFNNPVNFTDPEGLLTKPAHNVVIDHAFNSDPNYLLPRRELQILKQGSARVDERGAIKSEFSNEHAMAILGQQTLEQARVGIDSFIESQIQQAINAPNRDAALAELSEAFHTIADRTSDLHTDDNGNPRYFSLLDASNIKHFIWPKWYNGEDVDDLTPEMIDQAVREMREAYDRVFCR